MREVAEALKTLPRIFLDLVLPNLPGLNARLADGARVLDVGCGGGWGVVQIAERFPRDDLRRDRPRALLGRAGPAADRRAGPGGPL